MPPCHCRSAMLGFRFMPLRQNPSHTWQSRNQLAEQLTSVASRRTKLQSSLYWDWRPRPALALLPHEHVTISFLPLRRKNSHYASVYEKQYISITKIKKSRIPVAACFRHQRVIKSPNKLNTQQWNKLSLPEKWTNSFDFVSSIGLEYHLWSCKTVFVDLY